MISSSSEMGLFASVRLSPFDRAALRNTLKADIHWGGLAQCHFQTKGQFGSAFGPTPLPQRGSPTELG
jgi:hypothetical protein